MKKEIEELEAHGTWAVVRKSNVPDIKLEDGTTKKPQILAGTWLFRIKRFPSGILRKIKARFCAGGDLENDEDVFETYVPVISWSFIRMLLITSLQKNWKIEQIDFSNAFVQAEMKRDVYVSIPAMFGDFISIPSTELCLKLNKSLYGLREAPKLWHAWLAGIFYGRGMALAVYVDDVLLFVSNSNEMKMLLRSLSSKDLN